MYIKLPYATPNCMIYRRDCAFCKHCKCNEECSKCTNSEYDKETDKYNCNCLQETTIKTSTCPYFRADTGD